MASPAQFLRTIESDIGTLRQESRRVLPSVTDAAENVAIEIRHALAALNNTVPAGHAPSGGPISAAGRAGLSSATTSLDIDRHGPFLSQLLQPFIIACNHANAPKKVLTCALATLQRFVTADAIPATEYGNIVRVLEIQADHADEEVRLKVLQSLPLLLSQPSHYPDGRLVSSLLSLSFGFLRDKSHVLKHAATATIQQTAALMFERADKEAKAVLASSTVSVLTIKVDSSSMAAACRLFLQDVVMVAGGLPPQWIKRSAPVPRVLAADLIEYVVREHACLFEAIHEFQDLISSIIVPLILRQLPSQLSFPLALRFCRIARSVLGKLHGISPTPCRALLSLLVRMIYAAARGEDYGATASRSIDRFGSSGTRILAEAHKKLGGTAPIKAADETAFAPNALTLTFDGDENTYMMAVATLPLGPLPLWKCTLLLETLHSITLNPSVVCSLYETFDFSEDAVSVRESAPRKDVQHLVEGVVLLLQRLLQSSTSLSEPGDLHSKVSSKRANDARAIENDRASKSRGESVDEDGGVARQADDFCFYPEDVDAAALVHGKRPVANLTCADADTHVFLSSTGGLQAALAMAVAPNATASSGIFGLVGSVAGASVAYVAAKFADKDPSFDSAFSTDALPPPHDMDPASLVLSCLEILVNVAAAAAVAAERVTRAEQVIADPINNVAPSGVADMTHAHFASASMKDESGRKHKPLLSGESAPSHSLSIGLPDSSFPSRAVMTALVASLWRLLMEGLIAMLQFSSSIPICSYLLKAYQSFTYACGVLLQEIPRDAMMVNLCRMALPNWNPTPGATSVAMSLLGSDARNLPVTARNEIGAKHTLVLKTLFNIAHCLGGVLGVSWIVLIDTFEQFDRLLESDKRTSIRKVRRTQSFEKSATSAGLLQLLRNIREDHSAVPSPGAIPQLPASTLAEDDIITSSADTPDDELAVLAMALSTLFESTVHLSDSALKDLVTALSDLTITAFADSATAELADTPVSMISSNDAPIVRTSSDSRFDGLESAELQRGKPPKNSTALRKHAQTATDVFSVEQAAAEDARDIMATDLSLTSSEPLPLEGVQVTLAPTRSSAKLQASPPASGLPSSATIQPPFALTRLMETCAFNAWRLGCIWDPLSALLRVLARSRSPSVRQYGLNATADIAIAHILRLASAPRQKGRLTSVPMESVPQGELLSPMFDYWRNPSVESRIETIVALHRIVEETGSHLFVPETSTAAGGGWAVVLGLLHAVAVLSNGVTLHGTDLASPSGDTLSQGSAPRHTMFETLISPQLFDIPDMHGQFLSESSVQQLVAEAFRILELICDDFLDKIPPAGISYMAWLYALFARQRHAMNVSLTAVGQVWKLLDALRPLHSGAPELFQELWFQIFSMLSDLIKGAASVAVPVLPADSRNFNTARKLDWNSASVPPAKLEVRNIAVEIIFDSLISHARSLGPVMWRCITSDYVLPLIYHLTTIAQVNLAEDVHVEAETIGHRRGDAASSIAVQYRIDHARDTVGKQWNETRVLAYQGFVRTIVKCFPLLQPLPWFAEVWTETLAIIERSIIGKAVKGSNGPDDIVLEPIDVSVPAIACLQQLALLVCVPAGVARPADDEDKYSFDMRVVDGALVRVAAATESGPHWTKLPGVTDVSEPLAARAVGLQLRDHLWQDVRAVLRGVCVCSAVTSDEEESVAVALVDVLSVLLTAAVVGPTDICSTLGVMLLVHDEMRLTEVVELLWNIVALRRTARWNAANSHATGGAHIAGLPALPTSPNQRPSDKISILAEDLVAPKIDVASNLDRALLRSIEACIRGFYHLTLRTVGRTLPESCLSQTAQEQLLSRAWCAVLELCCKLAYLSDVEFFSEILRKSSTQSSLVALPASALNLQATKLLHRIFSTTGKLELVVPPEQAENAARAHTFVGKAVALAFHATVPALASCLMSQRSVTDVASSEMERFERSASKAVKDEGSVAARPLNLLTICNLMRLRLPCGEAAISRSTSLSFGESTRASTHIYPVKVWGFGLGGSYGSRGDGSLVVADTSKAKRSIARNVQYAENVVAALVAAVGTGVSTQVSDSAAEMSSPSEIWLSLLTTLHALLGFPMSASMAPLSTPGTVRRGASSSEAGESPRNLLNATLEASRQCVPETISRDILTTMALERRVHAKAWIAFDAENGVLDDDVWAATSAAHQRDTTASEGRAETHDGSSHSVSVSLKALVGPQALVSSAPVEAAMRSEQFAAACHQLGWRRIQPHHADTDDVSGAHTHTVAPKRVDMQLDAETFLLRAVIDGFCAQVLIADSSRAFQSLLAQLLLLLNASMAILAFNPFGTADDASHPLSAAAAKDVTLMSLTQGADSASATIDTTSWRRLRAFSRMAFDAAFRLASLTPNVVNEEDTNIRIKQISDAFAQLCILRCSDCFAATAFVDIAHTQTRLRLPKQAGAAKSTGRKDVSTSAVGILDFSYLCNQMGKILDCTGAGTRDHFADGLPKMYTALSSCVTHSEPLVRHWTQRLLFELLARRLLIFPASPLASGPTAPRI